MELKKLYDSLLKEIYIRKKTSNTNSDKEKMVILTYTSKKYSEYIPIKKFMISDVDNDFFESIIKYGHDSARYLKGKSVTLDEIRHENSVLGKDEWGMHVLYDDAIKIIQKAYSANEDKIRATRSLADPGHLKPEPYFSIYTKKDFNRLCLAYFAMGVDDALKKAYKSINK